LGNQRDGRGNAFALVGSQHGRVASNLDATSHAPGIFFPVASKLQSICDLLHGDLDPAACIILASNNDAVQPEHGCSYSLKNALGLQSYDYNATDVR
jgi:hypothetical protein